MSGRAEADGSAKPLVFVTLGTDHHPFDRLVDWVDGWIEAIGEGRAEVLVQSGASRLPTRAKGQAFLERKEMAEMKRRARVVVTHGGSATTLELVRLGVVPIVVPRRKDLGEHVDDHQAAFAARLEAEGEVRIPRDEAEFRRLLDEALAKPQRSKRSVDTGAGDAARRVEELVGELDRGATPQPVSTRSRVLYIAGVGRSGTTLLDRMLGQLDGFESVGELVHVWLRGLFENDACGCGERFRDCPFWRKVGEHSFGDWNTLNPREIVALHRRVDRHRYIPLMLQQGLWPTYRQDFRTFAAHVGRLYAGITEASGGNIIVDSSKHASYAFVLREAPGIDLRVVHLLRRSHGVAYSWTKRVRRPEVPGRVTYMAQFHPARMAGRWVSHNLLIDALQATGSPLLRVRYEDLVREPRAGVERILRFAGVDPAKADLSFISDGSIELEPSHSASGNPMRFKNGRIDLRIDDEWRTKMDPRHRRLVTAITAPMLARYGYLPGETK